MYLTALSFVYRCTETEGCNVFTHFIDMESCYLLTKCEEYVACENCISGPKTPSFERNGTLSIKTYSFKRDFEDLLIMTEKEF